MKEKMMTAWTKMMLPGKERKRSTIVGMAWNCGIAHFGARNHFDCVERPRGNNHVS